MTETLNLVPFVSVDAMMKLVLRVGVERAISPRSPTISRPISGAGSCSTRRPASPAHSAEGVIELMPTSDGEVYGFKYVNGHPANTKRGLQTVTAFGLLARCGQRLPRAAFRDDDPDRAAHGGDLRRGGAGAGAEGRADPWR
jgi:ornithine cyclodeaminase